MKQHEISWVMQGRCKALHSLSQGMTSTYPEGVSGSGITHAIHAAHADLYLACLIWVIPLKQAQARNKLWTFQESDLFLHAAGWGVARSLDAVRHTLHSQAQKAGPSFSLP